MEESLLPSGPTAYHWDHFHETVMDLPESPNGVFSSSLFVGLCASEVARPSFRVPVDTVLFFDVAGAAEAVISSSSYRNLPDVAEEGEEEGLFLLVSEVNVSKTKSIVNIQNRTYHEGVNVRMDGPSSPSDVSELAFSLGTVPLPGMHSHTCNATTDSQQRHLPPFVWLNPVLAAAADVVVPPPLAIVFATDLPPFGWEPVSTNMSGRLIRLTDDPFLAGQMGGSILHHHLATMEEELNCSTFRPEMTVSIGSGLDVWVGVPEHLHWLRTDFGAGDEGGIPSNEGNAMPPNCALFAIRRKEELFEVQLGEIRPAFFVCFEVPSSDLLVCRGRGRCEQIDVCSCESPYFGRDCAETIREAAFVSETRVEIVYEASASLLAPLVLDTLDGSGQLQFVCSDLITNLLVSDVVCSFQLSFLQSSVIYVDFASTPSPAWEEVVVLPLTANDDADVVVLPITPYTPPIVFSPSSRTTLLSFLENDTTSCRSVGCGVKRAKRQKKHLDDLNSVEDIDILLEQAKNEEGDSPNFANVKINKRLFEVSASEVELIKEIGRGGSHSVVYLARWAGKECGYKLFCWREGLEEDLETFVAMFEREVTVLATVLHPFILSYYGATVRLPRIGSSCLGYSLLNPVSGYVMEYCSNGDLEVYLNSTPETSQLTRLRFLTEIAGACAYLHNIPILHRDLKPSNVLLTERLGTRLMDFGLAKISRGEASERNMTRRIGTAVYMAPEVVVGSEYDCKADVFSFGIMGFEILSGDFDPYNGAENCELKVTADPNFRPKRTPSVVREQRLTDAHFQLFCRCWAESSADRPRFDEILANLTAFMEQSTTQKVDHLSARDGELASLEDVDEWIAEIRTFVEDEEAKKEQIE